MADTTTIVGLLAKYEDAVRTAIENDEAFEERENGPEGSTANLAEEQANERERQGEEWAGLLAEAVVLLKVINEKGWNARG